MNKRNIPRILAAALITVALAACVKGVNDEKLTPPAFSKFGTSNLTGKYFVTNSTASVFKIPIGITAVANTDRTIQLTISSSTGAVAGTQYTAPTSIVIPAGQSLDSLAIKGIFAGYPAGRRDTLRITITGGDVPVSIYANTYTLVMQKYCDVVLATMSGNYTNTRDYVDNSQIWGPYGATVSDPTPGTNGNGISRDTIRIANFWDVGYPLDVVLDWSDPATFTTTVINGQPLGSDPTYGPMFARARGTGTFSSCDN
ncbi:MAG: hypothetical protein ABW019_04265, partial [Chitinophagaceae bacterium]